jgi:ankyrin repeat protein
VADEDGNTALNYSCLFPNASLVKTLLAYDADIDIPNKKGQTPRYWAERKEAKDIVALLEAQKRLIEHEMRELRRGFPLEQPTPTPLPIRIRQKQTGPRP